MISSAIPINFQFTMLMRSKELNCVQKSSTQGFKSTDLRDEANQRIGCPAPFAKIFPLHTRPKSPAYSVLSRARERGVGHRHERWARGAVDAVASSRLLARTSDVAADGEVVWFRRPDAGVTFLRSKLLRGNGDNKAGHRGEHEGNR
jgi:hypothetical protein